MEPSPADPPADTHAPLNHRADISAFSSVERSPPQPEPSARSPTEAMLVEAIEADRVERIEVAVQLATRTQEILENQINGLSSLPGLGVR